MSLRGAISSAYEALLCARRVDRERQLACQEGQRSASVGLGRDGRKRGQEGEGCHRARTGIASGLAGQPSKQRVDKPRTAAVPRRSQAGSSRHFLRYLQDRGNCMGKIDGRGPLRRQKRRPRRRQEAARVADPRRSFQAPKRSAIGARSNRSAADTRSRCCAKRLVGTGTDTA